MARSEAWNPPPGHDPTPNVASVDDLRRADELRHRLEARYFGETAATFLHGHAHRSFGHWSEMTLDDSYDT
jgi:hypothetical protein